MLGKMCWTINLVLIGKSITSFSIFNWINFHHFNQFRALFGYVKQSNDLEVVSKGTGLDDLVEEFNSSKILYALVKVIDPNTELSKHVLINWVS